MCTIGIKLTGQLQMSQIMNQVYCIVFTIMHISDESISVYCDGQIVFMGCVMSHWQWLSHLVTEMPRETLSGVCG